MPYASVHYRKSNNSYTFFTNIKNLEFGDAVLVKDKSGFDICYFEKYVEKPDFKCRFIIASQKRMENMLKREKRRRNEF